jgi:hypothetical protein
MEARLSAALQQAKSASDQAERFMNEAEKLKVSGYMSSTLRLVLEYKQCSF